jgi:UDP-glucose 4-epimerase
MNILNFLVIGSNGFIGNKLSKKLKKSGHNIISLKRISSTSIETIKESQIDYCIHAASGIVPSSRAYNFFEEYDNLISKTFLLIDACQQNNIPFIYLSSAGAIYEDSSLSINEESRLNQSTFYGASKHIIEQYIFKKNLEKNLDYLILRPTNVYGRNLDNVNANQGFIENSIKQIISSKPINLYSSSSKFRDFLFVDDLVEIFSLLIDRGVMNEVINIGSGKVNELREIIDELYKLLNQKPNIKISKERSYDKNIIDIDISYLGRFIDYQSKDIYSGLECYLSRLNILSSNKGK